MLVLSRKTTEQLVIRLGEEIVRVRIVSFSGNKVRLGVEASPNVGVFREEVWQRQAGWRNQAANAETNRSNLQIAAQCN